MTDHISTTWTGEDVTIEASGKSLQGYHHLEVEADHSYAIDLWKDGAIARGRKGYRLKENTNPGIELAISTDGPQDDDRYGISPGRSSDTSHYADVREFDETTLRAAADAVQDYMAELDDTGVDDVADFFEDISAGRL